MVSRILRDRHKYWQLNKRWGVGLGLTPLSFNVGISIDHEWWVWLYLPFCWACIYREEQWEEEDVSFLDHSVEFKEFLLRRLSELPIEDKLEFINRISTSIEGEKDDIL
jgi:hypothetical protein